MSIPYTVTFAIPDGIAAGLQSGEYALKGGNVINAIGRPSVVKWLEPMQIAQEQGQTISSMATGLATGSLALAAVNVALNVAVLRGIGELKALGARHLQELGRVMALVSETYSEVVEAGTLRELGAAIGFLERATVSSNPERFLIDAQSHLVRCGQESSRWLQKSSNSQFLKHHELAASLYTSLAASSVLEAQVARQLGESPEAVSLPTDRALPVLEETLARLPVLQQRLPGKGEVEGLHALPGLRRDLPKVLEATVEGARRQRMLVEGEAKRVRIEGGQLHCEMYVSD